METPSRKCAACGASVGPLSAADDSLGEQCLACGHVAPDLAVAYPCLEIAKLVRSELLAVPGRSASALRCLAIANLFVNADLVEEERWSRRAARFDREAGHAEGAMRAERRADSCKQAATGQNIARTAAEMRFLASIASCDACRKPAPDARFELFGTRTKWMVVGTCPHCKASRSLSFETEGDPHTAPCPPGELGDARPSAIIAPAAFLAELARLAPLAADDDAVRARAILCIRELMKSSPAVLASLRVTSASLLLEEQRLHAAALAARAAPIARVLRILFDDAGPPPTVGALEQALGLQMTEAHVAPNANGRIAFAAGPLVSLGPEVDALSAEYSLRRAIVTLADLRARPLTRWSIAFRRGADALRAAAERREGWTFTPSTPDGACTLVYVEAR